eukprot:scaffold3296_cov26-Prasinocladus_malaysianus.AAC.1
MPRESHARLDRQPRTLIVASEACGIRILEFWGTVHLAGYTEDQLTEALASERPVGGSPPTALRTAED